MIESSYNKYYINQLLISEKVVCVIKCVIAHSTFSTQNPIFVRHGFEKDFAILIAECFDSKPGVIAFNHQQSYRHH